MPEPTLNACVHVTLLSIMLHWLGPGLEMPYEATSMVLVAVVVILGVLCVVVCVQGAPGIVHWPFSAMIGALGGTVPGLSTSAAKNFRIPPAAVPNVVRGPRFAVPALSLLLPETEKDHR